MTAASSKVPFITVRSGKNGTLGNVVAGQRDATELASSTRDFQRVYLRRRTLVPPALVPTLADLVFGEAGR